MTKIHIMSIEKYYELIENGEFELELNKFGFNLDNEYIASIHSPGFISFIQEGD